MIKFVAYLIFASLLGVGIFWLDLNSGDLSFTILDYNIETKVAYAAAILLIALLVLNFVFIFLAKIFALPRFIKEALKEKRKNKQEARQLELIEAMIQDDHVKLSQLLKNLNQLILPETIRDQLKVTFNKLNNDSAAYKSSLLSLLKYPALKTFAYQQLLNRAVNEQDWQIACNYGAELWKVNASEEAAKVYIQALYNAHKFKECLKFLNQFKMLRFLNKKSRDTLEGLCYWELAKAEANKESFDKAIAYFEYSIDKLREFIPALKELIELKINDGQFSEAVKLIERIWKKFPHHALSKLVMKLSTHYKAEEFYKIIRRIVASNPKHYESQLILAESLMMSHQFEQASKEIALALSHSERHRALLLMAKFCLLYHANADEALQWLNQVADSKNDAHETNYYLDFNELNIATTAGNNCKLVATLI